MLKFVIFIVVLCAFKASANVADIVEWRDYINGEVPPNPIPAGGDDLEQRSLYIGLAYVKNGTNEGLMPTLIHRGVPYVNVTLDDEHRIEVWDNIKILCGKGDYLNRLYWKLTRSQYFEGLFDDDDNYPVQAGWQVGEFNEKAFNATLYMGRGMSGHYWIGKIYTGNADLEKNNIMFSTYYFADAEVVHFVEYQVLMYRR